MGEFIGKRIVPRHEGDWDRTRSYEPLMIVLDPESGDGYISRYDVPAGTALTNTHYWALCSHFNAQMHRLETDLDTDVTAMHRDLANAKQAMSTQVSEALSTMTSNLTQTKQSMMQELTKTQTSMSQEFTETHAEMQEELDTAKQEMSEELRSTSDRLSTMTKQSTSDMNAARQEMNNAVSVLTKRLDANVSAHTTMNRDYAAEVVDARVDDSGEIHETLGSAVRSNVSGLTLKLIPKGQRAIVANDSTATMEMLGAVGKCTYDYQSGYVAFLMKYFDSYEQCKGKKYRIVLVSDNQAVSAQVVVTNSINGWGSSDGTISYLPIRNVQLNESNRFFTTVDIDFSEERWGTFAEKYTTRKDVVICIRKENHTEHEQASFNVYVYEIQVDKDFFWKYVSEYDHMRMIEQELLQARGTKESVHDRLLENEQLFQEVTEAHVDSHNLVYESLSERLDRFDSLIKPNMTVMSYYKPKDNANTNMTQLVSDVETTSQMVSFLFDVNKYESDYPSYQWQTLHFSSSYSREQFEHITDENHLCVDIKVEGVGDNGNCGHDGEVFTFNFYVNGTPNWGTVINPMTKVNVPIGGVGTYQITQKELKNVIDNGVNLHLVFVGSSLNTESFHEIGKLRISVVVYDTLPISEVFGAKTHATSAKLAAEALHAVAAATATDAENAIRAEHAENAENAEMAQYAVNAENSQVAMYSDNYFLQGAASLLNIEGKRYSKGMDTVEIPEQYPYRYAYAGQEITGLKASIIGEGFEQSVRLEMNLNKNAYRPQNQGYVKHMGGMLTFDEWFEKLEEGYEDLCVCHMEDSSKYPEQSLEGEFPQIFLVAYTGLSGSNTIIVRKSFVAEREITEDKILRLWRISISEAHMDAIRQAKEAGVFKATWFGIWHTRKYTAETPGVWQVQWYWQDFAITDGSYSDEEMLTYFQKKYGYWVSYVNHLKLKTSFDRISEKFTEVDEALESVEATKIAVGEALDGIKASGVLDDNREIVCWGDSLTVLGGWTTTLEKLSGIKVYNGGTGGESAKTIVARQGADVMMINNITIPAECEPVTIAVRAQDVGIPTAWGEKVTPLLQGSTHVNPVMIGNVEGTLRWTGANHSDMTGIWTFTRATAGDEVEIRRPTAIRTAFDRIHNTKDTIMVIFIGQNGGYRNFEHLIWMHKQMIDHCKGKEYVILGLSSGTAEQRKEYETVMKDTFGRRFISLREYLTYPVYDESGNLISSYGMQDAGIIPNEEDLERLKVGQVPQSMLIDSVHYNNATKTVIGEMLYKKMVELGIFD